jgi:hypothetical protein
VSGHKADEVQTLRGALTRATRVPGRRTQVLESNGQLRYVPGVSLICLEDSAEAE